VKKLNSVAFDIFGLTINWYGILLTAGIVAGVFFAYFEAKRIGENTEIILDLALLCVPSAVIGARIYYVLFNLDYYQGDFLRMINIREGGLAIHGAIIMALIVAFIYLSIKKKSFLKFADIVAPAIILGQAIGRWGNFTNGEAHGGPTNLPWGIMVDGVRVHPTFLYESIWNFLIFIFLVWLSRRKKFDGQLILLYAALYSVGRFFIEGMRTDSLMFLGFRAAEIISVIIVIFSVAVYMVLSKKIKRDDPEEVIDMDVEILTVEPIIEIETAIETKTENIDEAKN